MFYIDLNIKLTIIASNSWKKKPKNIFCFLIEILTKGFFVGQKNKRVLLYKIKSLLESFFYHLSKIMKLFCTSTIVEKRLRHSILEKLLISYLNDFELISFVINPTFKTKNSNLHCLVLRR